MESLFDKCSDVIFQPFEYANESSNDTVVLAYCKGISDEALILKTVMPGLNDMFRQSGFAGELLAEHANLLLFPFTDMKSEDDAIRSVLCGNLLIWFERRKRLYCVHISDTPERKPEDSSVEPPIFGPRDAFVENLSVNVALIRKRMRSPSLKFECFSVGTHSRTDIGLLYLEHTAAPDVIGEIRKRIEKLEIEALYSNEQLKNLVSDQSLTLFPLMGITSRPDHTLESLLRGRFALIVDGLPAAQIAPVTLSYLFNAAEDAHSPVLYVSFSRLLRKLSLFITLFLPGLWASLTTFHQDQIPFPLLSTIIVSTQGVPMSSSYELLLMILMFRLFFEAGSRLPSTIGPALSVVGGLIVGDATIRAGMTSPTTLIIAALTFTAGFTNQSHGLNASTAILQIVILLLSTYLGLFGFFIGMFGIVLYWASLSSFGVPYLAPISPPNFKSLAASLIKIPWTYSQRSVKARVVTEPDRSERKEEK
ncbi:spore germination protein [Paenibacillus contaminans]|uniref:spore germination protein n=1 Tax=Paenibacillus contaminans TaxID=450362 RepID=UPI00235774DB|nr:spore germination protein [Paenibacillus contaminans]